MLRSLICAFVGHVDVGKTTLQDKIRGTSVAKSEPGLITQSISFTNVPLATIKNICGPLLKGKEIQIPGFLFLDTPGHASFTNLRKRGGNLADIAVLVIDINEGIKPQTLEAIEILKTYKTPFVIAATKIDLISGYRKNKPLLLENIASQSETVKAHLDKKLYEIVGKLAELNFNSDRFDRIEDYSKQVAIIPLSAKSNDGIPELLLVLSGLAKKYLERELKVNVKNPGKATVMEVKEEKGLGITLDIILYDGHLKINDRILIGTLEKPIITKIKALFLPEGNRLKSVNKVEAACGVKVSALDIENVIGGMPLRVANKDIEAIKEEIQEEIDEVIIKTDKEGLIVKADTLGSLEALVHLLKEKKIKIKKATIGNITKKDIAEALSERNQL
ncbi:translation initiation factor IF-2, partial [Candidatus Woesearchaeota archaeon]|nr:translation initiation factor IF-2 [Candidatus Woesearchaeota archaeon]